MEQGNHIYHKPTCPFGQKAISLLQKKGIAFEDHIFASAEEEKAFKEQYHVKTTPQIFLDGKRIGGYTDLAAHFGETPVETASANKKSYTPIIAVFTTTALLTFATSRGMAGFMGFSLCVLALLKLMDIPAFVRGFKQYDLLSQRLPLYATTYPFLEMLAGLGFLTGFLPLLTGLISTSVGFLGGVSVIKAVYIDKKNLNCACIGGNAKIPLGAISFTENAMMVIMGLALLIS